MKKYLVTLFVLFFLLSCSALNIIGNYQISNDRVKEAIAKKVDGYQDYVIIKGSSKVKEVYVENNKLQVIIDIETSNLLDAIFSSSPSNKIILNIESDIRYNNGKVYSKNIRVKDIKGITSEEQIKQISNAIVYTLLDNKEIYDFSKEGIDSKNIKNVYIGNSSIIVDFK